MADGTQTAETRPPPLKKGRALSAARSALLLLVAFALALLLAEAAARWLSPQPLSVPLVEFQRGIEVNRRNVDGSGSAPGLFSVTYRTNGQGFRGTEAFARAPSGGAVRIAAIGDSFTFWVRRIMKPIQRCFRGCSDKGGRSR
jgi:hypothetical protein